MKNKKTLKEKLLAKELCFPGDVDQILKEVRKELMKKVSDKRYRKVLGGYRQKGELGIATNLSYCEGGNRMLSKVKSVIDEVLK